MSDQKVNLDKSEMIFNPNLKPDIKKDFQTKLPINISNKINKYLGLPTQVGRSKVQDFNFIMDKVIKKLKGWKERNLSFAGRGVLIKAVAQAIPVFVMSCFLLPQETCDKIERAECQFWWGSKGDNRKIHWVKKEKVFKPTTDGGLGFRNLRDFNMAMLAKQIWRLYTNQQSLISKVFKAKYYPTTDVLQATIGHAPSYAWRSLHQALWVLKKGCCWKVGNGASIDIWEDNWLHQQNGYKVLTKNPGNPNIKKVQDLMLDNPPRWNIDLIDNTFISFEGALIKQIPLTHTRSQDSIMWMLNDTGEYSVKTGYYAQQIWKTQQAQGASNSDVMDTVWKKVWDLDTIPRHKVLLWRIINKALPVRDDLHKRGINCSLLCPRCENGIETIDHLFLKCENTRRELFGSNLGINFQSKPSSDFIEWLILFIYKNEKNTIVNLAALLYSIWHARNQRIF